MLAVAFIYTKPELDFYILLYFQPTLGVSEPNEALLYCIMSPVGPYFKTGSFKPVSLMADKRFVRSWHGGSGDNKAGGYVCSTRSQYSEYQ